MQVRNVKHFNFLNPKRGANYKVLRTKTPIILQYSINKLTILNELAKIVAVTCHGICHSIELNQ